MPFANIPFTYLGFSASKCSFRPDPDRFSALALPRSSNSFIELSLLLELFQFYFRFILDFSGEADSLLDLRPKRTFHWTAMHKRALRRLLNYYSTNDVLSTLSLKLQSVVITNASSTLTRVVIEQNEHSIICFPRRPGLTERGYSMKTA